MGTTSERQMGLHSVWFLSLLAAALPTSGASLFEVPADASGFDFGAVSAPVLPTQFSGTIETVALLLDKDIEYPPRVKRYEVHYDWDKKMAKVAVTAGDEWDEYILRYDQDMEHHIEMEGKQRKCYVSELRVKMPLPERMKWPRLVGIENKGGHKCYRWTEGKGDSKVDYFETVQERRPVHLATPAMTYDFVNFKSGPPDPEVFAVESRQCEEQVGGFPYVHVWHYYIRM